MKVRILDRAEDDLVDGFWFYEDQQSGLCRYFLDQLYADIGLLDQFGGIHRVVFAGFQRRLSRKFPYAIYYKVDDEFVLAHAVLDCRMSPRRIRQTLLNR